jgi:hypothetical protein
MSNEERDRLAHEYAINISTIYPDYRESRRIGFQDGYDACAKSCDEWKAVAEKAETRIAELEARVGELEGRIINLVTGVKRKWCNFSCDVEVCHPSHRNVCPIFLYGGNSAALAGKDKTT